MVSRKTKLPSTAPPRSDRRLLLLEFVTHERWIYNSRAYPFINGCAEASGFSTRWLCFGAEIWTDKLEGLDFVQYVPLTGEDLEVLGRHVDELNPTHIIVSHSVSPMVRERLQQGQSVSILSMDDTPTFPGEETLMTLVTRELAERAGTEESLNERRRSGLRAEHGHAIQRNGWLLGWLGNRKTNDPRTGQYIVDSWTPSYGAIMANSLATKYQPHLLLLGGIACDYRRKVKENELYKNLDLTRCDQDFGCACCTWFRGAASDLARDPLDLARMQIERVLETAGSKGRNQGIFDLLDVRLFRLIDRFADMVLSLPLPPSQFFFEPRADRVLEVGHKLERVLPRLKEAGHSIGLFRMGAENLVEEENLLLNKNISLEQIDAAQRLLERIKNAYPDHFQYDPTWGYITCSPWTTLEMFELGIQRCQERDFDPTGVWLYTPLLLYRGSPVTELATHDGGIIVDEWDDISYLYEPAVNNVSVSSFLPWRFRDDRMSVAFALSVRFSAAALRDRYPDTILQDDELYQRLVSNREIDGLFDRPDEFTMKVITLLKGMSPPYDRMAILDEAVDQYIKRTVPSLEGQTQGGDGIAQHVEPADPVRQQKLEYLLKAVKDHFGPRFDAVEVEKLWEQRLSPSGESPRTEIRIDLRIGGQPVDLTLSDPATTERYFFKTRRFAVTHQSTFKPETEQGMKKAMDLIRAFEKALEQYAPDLLPSGDLP